MYVMVTHNPELAQQYATRIVELKDGKIRSDSDAFYVDEETADGVDQGTPHYMFDETDNARVKSFLSKIL